MHCRIRYVTLRDTQMKNNEKIRLSITSCDICRGSSNRKETTPNLCATGSSPRNIYDYHKQQYNIHRKTTVWRKAEAILPPQPTGLKWLATADNIEKTKEEKIRNHRLHLPRQKCPSGGNTRATTNAHNQRKNATEELNKRTFVSTHCMHDSIYATHTCP